MGVLAATESQRRYKRSHRAGASALGWSPLIVVCLAEYFNWIRVERIGRRGAKRGKRERERERERESEREGEIRTVGLASRGRLRQRGRDRGKEGETARVIYRLTMPGRLVINYVVLLLYIKITGR